MTGTLVKLITFWALLIALYLVLSNYVGASNLLGAIDNTGSGLTKTLQGR